MRNEKLQSVCRDYLSRLKPVANRFGLGGWVDGIISANKRNECSGTEEEVELLGRALDDERLHRQDVPKVLGKSYRQSMADGDFDRIRTLKRVGIYSKLSVLLLKDE